MTSVGITGGIGSGKSVVCKIFSLLGVPVYHADARAASIMNSDENVTQHLKRLFGEQIYVGGLLDRKAVASKVFTDERLLNEVNGIVHPVVKKDFETWRTQQEAPYVIHEAAILFESGVYTMMDVVLTVYAPVKIRVKRIMDRDGLSSREVTLRIQQQWSEKKRQQMADFIINNDGKHLVIPRVLSIHQLLMKK